MRFKKIIALFCASVYMMSSIAFAADVAQNNKKEEDTAAFETSAVQTEDVLDEAVTPVVIAGELELTEEDLIDPEEQETVVEVSDSGAVAVTRNVAVSNHKMTVNGKSVSPQAYIIDGYNYYKLRDIAYVLNGTTSKFAISWKSSSNTINMLPGNSYTAVGGEMNKVPVSNIKLSTSTATVMLNGTKVSVEGYNINNNNYYKVADLAKRIGFTADFNSSTRTVTITTPTESATQPDPEPETPSGTRIDGKMTVILDAGHGGSDVGAQHPSLTLNGTLLDEKRVNLYVTQYLKQYLEAQGVRVIMVRNTLEEGSSLTLRGTVMEQNAATTDLFFSVHHNAYNGTAKGAQVLAQVQDQNGGPTKILATELNKEYANIGLSIRPIWFREGSNGDYYYTNRKAAELKIPAVISEFCFIDNDSDVLFIDSDADWQREARGLCNAIMNYFAQVEY